MSWLPAFAVALALLPALALADVPGPINAQVVSVYDGDTLTVDAQPWPGWTVRVKVRVDGIDTPEIRGRCQAEKDLAIEARDFVRATVGETVQLTNVRLGKYAGRVIAVVWVGRQKLADIVIREGLGRPYDGGRREGWCGQ
ncbi:MAG: thermonuclease family protein [Proteobacteria bacterium]|nr:thermonuclease family protein [Pseudomonadota bacterium]